VATQKRQGAVTDGNLAFDAATQIKITGHVAFGAGPHVRQAR
jgi:hypothetical protein